MKNLIDLTGKKILVTGASSGIGRQTAITLSEVGARVILTARKQEQLKETQEMLSGNGHVSYPYDLCDLQNLGTFVKKIVEQNGRMQGLAFCAGISEVRPCKLTTPQVMLHTMTTNFFSYFELVRQFTKKRYSDDRAKIVVISSVASIKSEKGLGAYTASKAAIDGSLSALAQELMSRQININSIRPGMVDTPMAQNAREEERKYVMGSQALGFVSAEDVAIMCAYLSSSAADMITGRSFDIDGGRLLV